jgi:hypothetical protein
LTLISGQNDPEFYILPDIGEKIAEIEQKTDAQMRESS